MAGSLVPAGLTPQDIIERISAELTQVYAHIEHQLTEQVARRVARDLAADPDMLVRLRAVRDLRQHAERLLAGLDPAATAQAVTAIAGQHGAAAVAVALTGIPDLVGTRLQVSSLRAVTLVAEQLTHQLGALHARILRAPGDLYQRAIARAVPSVLTGATTAQAARALAAEVVLEGGLTGFLDASGREWRIGTYAEMATRTAVKRAWEGAGIARMQSSGITLVTPAVGNSACPACAAWIGKVLSTDGTPAGTYEMQSVKADEVVQVVVDGTWEDARVHGLGHPNCGCIPVAVQPGVAISTSTTHDPEAYKEKQELRRLERKVRDGKRAGNGSRVRAAQAEIRDHIDQTGLIRRRHREQLTFSDGKPRRKTRLAISAGGTK